VAFSDDGHFDSSAKVMLNAFDYLHGFDKIIINHEEETTLCAEGVMNEGHRSAMLGLKGRPTVAEDIAVARDILLAEFDSLDILVNHHPSKVGGDSERRRAIAQRRMRDVMDSLQASGHGRIVSVGDFNDNVWGSPGAPGTIKYNGAWEKIDGYFARGLKVRESVFADPLLSERDRSFGGTKPRRAFVGPRYNGGVSDHYPIVLWLK
jgi:hypothetical protein